MTRLLPIMLVTLVIGFPSLALASGAAGLGDDEISLKDGGMLRGTIVAVEPGNEATIVVKGKERTIAWSKIAKVERGKYKEDADEPTAAKPKKPKKPKKERKEDDDEALSEPAQGAPRMSIRATYPDVELMKVESTIAVVSSRGSATGVVTRGVCAAPCDEIIDGRDGTQFFFAAPGMVPSQPFKLTNYDGDVEARVRGGSVWRRWGGIMLTGLGGVAVLSGALFAIMPLPSFDPKTGRSVDGSRIPGIIGFVAGAGAMAGGIYMWTTSATTFEITPRTAKSAGVRIENGALLF